MSGNGESFRGQRDGWAATRIREFEGDTGRAKITFVESLYVEVPWRQLTQIRWEILRAAFSGIDVPR